MRRLLAPTEYYPHGTYIWPFIGWARFGDKKPVIGKDKKDWICLHDCPNGNKPGIIPDINKWTKKTAGKYRNHRRNNRNFLMPILSMNGIQKNDPGREDVVDKVDQTLFD